MTSSPGAEKAIDPGRNSIGKGLLGGTGAFSCERQSYFGETVRLPNGWRVQRLMPERVHFGKGLDVAHAQAVHWMLDGAAIEDLQTADRVQRLMELGYYVALAEPWSDDAGQPYERTDEDTAVLALQLANAIALLVGAAPNRLPKDLPTPTQPIPLLHALPGQQRVHVQGLDGRTMEIPDIFGNRPLGCTPDYVYSYDEAPERMLTGWLDVKAVGRSYSYPDKWLGAEAVLYTYAITRLNDGVMPQRVGYQEYRRLAKPYWYTTWTVPDVAWLNLAEAYIRRWNTALGAQDPEALQFNTRECGKCPFREAIPETTHTGCRVGQAVVRMQTGATGD